MKIGQETHGYVVTEFWDYKQFLDIVTTLSKVSTRKAWWIRLIKANKLICPVTNKKVAYVSLDKFTSKRKKIATFHYNFYSTDGDLFTVDHIIPRSKGGAPNDVDNLQPMIAEHNWDKGNDTDYQFMQMGDKKNIYGKSLEKPISISKLKCFSNNGGTKTIVTPVKYGDLPKDLLCGKYDYKTDEIVYVKVSPNWGYDLSCGNLKIIPQSDKFNTLISSENISHITNMIKNGGTHSENILRTFITSLTSLSIDENIKN